MLISCRIQEIYPQKPRAKTLFQKKCQFQSCVIHDLLGYATL